MKKLVLLTSIIIFFCNCAKEDQLSPSYNDRDWYSNEDSDDPVQHACYLLYKKYGIPIFVNDTIGYENRGIDAYGNPIIYYKIIDMAYTLGSPITSDDSYMQSRVHTLIEKPADQLAGVDFLDKYLFSILPKKLHFNSILLLDSLYETSKISADLTHLPAYYGLTTLAIAQIPQIASMTEDKKQEQAYTILAFLASNELAKDAVSLADFYEISQAYYGGIVNPANPRMPGGRYEKYGFLDYGSNWDPSNDTKDPSEWIYRNITDKNVDLEDYIFACFQYEEKEFISKYAEYPLVLEKYNIIRELLIKINYL